MWNIRGESPAARGSRQQFESGGRDTRTEFRERERPRRDEQRTEFRERSRSPERGDRVSRRASPGRYSLLPLQVGNLGPGRAQTSAGPSNIRRSPPRDRRAAPPPPPPPPRRRLGSRGVGGLDSRLDRILRARRLLRKLVRQLDLQLAHRLGECRVLRLGRGVHLRRALLRRLARARRGERRRIASCVTLDGVSKVCPTGSGMLVAP